MTVIALQVGASDEDAYQRRDAASYSRTSTVSIVQRGSAGTEFDAGLRFTNVTIPRGALIQAAAIDLYLGFAPTFDDAQCSIGAHNHDDAPAFPAAAGANDVNTRLASMTTAAVAWNADGLLSSPGWVTSPDISAVVQEIVNRSGWASGNAIVVILKGDTGTSKSLYSASYDGTPANAAKLAVTAIQGGRRTMRSSAPPGRSLIKDINPHHLEW